VTETKLEPCDGVGAGAGADAPVFSVELGVGALGADSSGGAEGAEGGEVSRGSIWKPDPLRASELSGRVEVVAVIE
jgi:hypothetical protein